MYFEQEGVGRLSDAGGRVRVPTKAVGISVLLQASYRKGDKMSRPTL